LCENVSGKVVRHSLA